MAIILGIDPGSRVTGYGVIRQVGRQLSGQLWHDLAHFLDHVQRVGAG